MWSDTDLETRMYKALDELGTAKAGRYKRLYEAAREFLVDKVLPRTVAKEPQMTDHGPLHAQAVMDTAARLVGRNAFDRPESLLSGIDAYFLCLAILFHDAGMAYGRTDHQRRVAQIYRQIPGHEQRPVFERSTVSTIVAAHTGDTNSGSQDTIGSVPVVSPADGHMVKSREIAAILRFADELAEGPARTSRFVRNELDVVPVESEVYHEYADVTSVYVGRGEQRIVVSYEICLDDDKMTATSQRLRRLLEFVSERVIKLDRERRYARAYSELLAPFNRTEVTLNVLPLKGPTETIGPIELADRNVFAHEARTLVERAPEYDIDTLINRLVENQQGNGTNV